MFNVPMPRMALGTPIKCCTCTRQLGLVRASRWRVAPPLPGRQRAILVTCKATFPQKEKPDDRHLKRTGSKFANRRTDSDNGKNDASDASEPSGLVMQATCKESAQSVPPAKGPRASLDREALLSQFPQLQRIQSTLAAARSSVSQLSSLLASSPPPSSMAQAPLPPPPARRALQPVPEASPGSAAGAGSQSQADLAILRMLGALATLQKTAAAATGGDAAGSLSPRAETATAITAAGAVAAARPGAPAPADNGNVTDQLAWLRSECASLASRNEELSRTLEDAAARAERLAVENARLAGLAAARGGPETGTLVDNLQSRLLDKDQLITSLVAKIEDLSKQVQDGDRQLQSLLTGSSSNGASAAVTAEALRSRLVAQQSQLSEALDRAKELSLLLVQKEGALGGLQAALARAREEEAFQRSRAGQLEADLDAARDIVPDHARKRLEQQESELTQLQSALMQRDLALSDLRAALEAQASTARSLAPPSPSPGVAGAHVEVPASELQALEQGAAVLRARLAAAPGVPSAWSGALVAAPARGPAPAEAPVPAPGVAKQADGSNVHLWRRLEAAGVELAARDARIAEAVRRLAAREAEAAHLRAALAEAGARNGAVLADSAALTEALAQRKASEVLLATRVQELETELSELRVARDAAVEAATSAAASATAAASAGAIACRREVATALASLAARAKMLAGVHKYMQETPLFDQAELQLVGEVRQAAKQGLSKEGELRVQASDSDVTELRAWLAQRQMSLAVLETRALDAMRSSLVARDARIASLEARLAAGDAAAAAMSARLAEAEKAESAASAAATANAQQLQQALVGLAKHEARAVELQRRVQTLRQHARRPAAPPPVPEPALPAAAAATGAPFDSGHSAMHVAAVPSEGASGTSVASTSAPQHAETLVAALRSQLEEMQRQALLRAGGTPAPDTSALGPIAAAGFDLHAPAVGPDGNTPMLQRMGGVKNVILGDVAPRLAASERIKEASLLEARAAAVNGAYADSAVGVPSAVPKERTVVAGAGGFSPVAPEAAQGAMHALSQKLLGVTQRLAELEECSEDLLRRATVRQVSGRSSAALSTSEAHEAAVESDSDSEEKLAEAEWKLQEVEQELEAWIAAAAGADDSDDEGPVAGGHVDGHVGWDVGLAPPPTSEQLAAMKQYLQQHQWRLRVNRDVQKLKRKVCTTMGVLAEREREVRARQRQVSALRHMLSADGVRSELLQLHLDVASRSAQISEVMAVVRDMEAKVEARRRHSRRATAAAHAHTCISEEAAWGGSRQEVWAPTMAARVGASVVFSLAVEGDDGSSSRRRATDVGGGSPSLEEMQQRAAAYSAKVGELLSAVAAKDAELAVLTQQIEQLEGLLLAADVAGTRDQLVDSLALKDSMVLQLRSQASDLEQELARSA